MNQQLVDLSFSVEIDGMAIAMGCATPSGAIKMAAGSIIAAATLIGLTLFWETWASKSEVEPLLEKAFKQTRILYLQRYIQPNWNLNKLIFVHFGQSKLIGVDLYLLLFPSIASNLILNGWLWFYLSIILFYNNSK